MNTHRLNKLRAATLLLFGILLAVSPLSHADEKLQAILQVGQANNASSAKSQIRIDQIAEETRALLSDFKTVNKQIDGLKVYNARLRKQIKNQLRRMDEIEQSILQVTVIQRQMMPLVIRMIDGLELFVELDVPFHIDERRQRIAFLRGNLDRSDISVAEKFRQVLESYKIENEYGRKIDAYKGSVEIDGVERDVNFLRVGRIALLYQTTDTDVSGAWDQASRSWIEVDDGEYRNAILKGLRIARKEASIDLINLPVTAPEAAR